MGQVPCAAEPGYLLAQQQQRRRRTWGRVQRSSGPRSELGKDAEAGPEPIQPGAQGRLR